VYRLSASRVGASVLVVLLALFNRAATADELTDALVRHALGDHARAIALLTPLAERGDAVAQLKLGLAYARGEGVPRDGAAGLRWLTRAAEQGQAEAMFELGVAHRDGLGTPANGKQAIYWLRRAAERGVPHANNAIGELYLGHADIPRDYAAALVWFLRGAQLDDADSLYNIAVRYALGQGVVQDEVEAYKWFDLAANAGPGDVRSKAVRARQAIGERLMPLQVQEAKVATQDWLRAHRPATPAPEMPQRPASGTALLRHEPMD
jgi:uncharacterized protein